MAFGTGSIAHHLQAARRDRGISQRALSELAGVPQSQISRIEAGTVDLRLSSLVALAHALDLELTLVPRKALPAVHAIARMQEMQAAPGPTGRADDTPAYSLDEDD